MNNDSHQEALREAALYPVPPVRFPDGTPGQLRCMDAVAGGLRALSRRDLERLVKAVAEEVNEVAKTNTEIT